jgi:magnesium chelatase subunit I
MAALTDLKTLGDLERAGYGTRTVKDELRSNLIRKLRAGEELFPGILGFERSVLPQIQHGLLARHDLLLLGLRGQAKSRIVRLLPTLLDEFVPAVQGSELHDDPFRPITKYAREVVAEMGEETPIIWIPRAARYAEKLATPDTSIADLIGDIDPIKAATRKLTYADEEVIHFGIIPRMHRGIFALNELPDLAPRIQVGLLNIMEEQDVQIRGFNLRLPLDLLMVFTANPEDYTNRGSIITPLKDRIDSQILTHYPRSLDVAMAITQQEAWQVRDGEIEVHVPHFLREIVEQVAFEARKSEYVDQKSGVSARLTRTALEDLISAAERRAILNGETETTARISDLTAIEPAITGKVELVYEGEQEGAQNVARLLIGRALTTIFKTYFPDPSDKTEGRAAYQPILAWFSRGNTTDLGVEMAFDVYARNLDRVEGLHDAVRRHTSPAGPAESASAMEFVLEALHQHSLVGKDRVEHESRYTDLMGSVLGTIGRFDADDEDDDEDQGWDDYLRSG